MSTSKERIQVTLSPEMAPILARLAKRDKVPKATKAAQLLRIAMEMEEDVVLAEIVHERKRTAKRFLTHKQVWG